jgi:ribonucleotide reductase alpha subunit
MWKNASKQEMIAKTENENAQKSEKIAIDNLKKFKIEEFEKNLRNGKIYLEADEVNYAKQLFLEPV